MMLKKHIILLVFLIAILPVFNVLNPRLDKSESLSDFLSFKSDITFEELRRNGYSYLHSPCGFFHYAKIFGDTMVEYYVETDFHDYSSPPKKLELELDEEEMILNTSNQDRNGVKEELKSEEERLLESRMRFRKNFEKNKSVFEEIPENYVTAIPWRAYFIFMDGIDSISILNFVEDAGGSVMYFDQNWNSQTGGSFWVKNRETSILFRVQIELNETSYSFKKYVLKSERSIPVLDKEKLNARRREEKRKELYWEKNRTI